MFPQKIGNNRQFHYPLSQLEEHPFDMIRGFIQTNFNCKMHRHEFFELNIITGGHGMHYIEDDRFMVKRGHVFVIPPRIRLWRRIRRIPFTYPPGIFQTKYKFA